jgi:hypothetical protein
MTRSLFLATTCELLLVSALGCGSSEPPEVTDSGDPAPGQPGDAPEPAAGADVSAAKVRLAEVEKAIADKEKELADLRAEAAALRDQIAAAEPKGKVFRTSAELFSGMPEDAYPKAGPAAGIERAAALKWCQENLVGHSVEWTTTLTNPSVDGEGPFTVSLEDPRFNRHRQGYAGGPFDSCFVAFENHTLGGQTCEVLVGDKIWSTHVYSDCTQDEAKKLRAFDGKEVTLRARIEKVEFHDSGTWVESQEDEKSSHVTLTLTLGQAAIDGFLPEASRPKPEGENE